MNPSELKSHIDRILATAGALAPLTHIDFAPEVVDLLQQLLKDPETWAKAVALWEKIKARA